MNQSVIWKRVPRCGFSVAEKMIFRRFCSIITQRQEQSFKQHPFLRASVDIRVIIICPISSVVPVGRTSQMLYLKAKSMIIAFQQCRECSSVQSCLIENGTQKQKIIP